MKNPITNTKLQSLTLLKKGKVRDIYELDSSNILIVSSDRLSAFDVILDEAIPEKGVILTALSNYWFKVTNHLISNHISGLELNDLNLTKSELKMLEGRAVVVKKLEPILVEAVVRGYLVGSGWKDYNASGSVSGVDLDDHLKLSEKLPEPIFTPSTKADLGSHDENITFLQMKNKIGIELSNKIREKSIAIYNYAYQHAIKRGVIIADTKLEFGLTQNGELILMDELLTPDSSRFWSVKDYSTGVNPPSFDKQIIRDYLDEAGWDRTSRPPKIPQRIVEKTYQKYCEVFEVLTKD